MNDIQNWIKKIDKAEKKYADYHNLIKEIRSYYKNEKSTNKQNIFWASIETLKPFLYFKEPEPYIDQKEKTSTPAAAIACRILEKVLRRNLEKFDFDGVMKYVRNDFLLLGFGAAYEKYVPTFKKIKIEEKGKKKAVYVEVLDDERIETVYINPSDFIADSDKVNVWEDCCWVARKFFMTSKEIIEQFGKKFENLLIVDREDKREKSVLVYEILDKAEKKVLYLSKECPEFLKIKPMSGGVFPLAKPLFATLTNDGLIPVSDFEQLKPLLDELSGVTTRMQLTMQAIKVSGAYDGSFPELANILNKEVTLVALSDFDRLKESGGIRGIIDFAPIEQYINALEALARRRQDIIERIYEMTGVSDIMRGTSDKVETATAVSQKTNFGTLRNQDKQNDFQRFMIELLKIKAQMICEQFSFETLKKYADEGVSERDVDLAVRILKTDKLRDMVLGIETDTSFLQKDAAGKTEKAVTLIHTLIKEAFSVVSSQPLLLNLYRQMIESVAVTLPNARQYEPIIEQAFLNIEADLKEKLPTPPNVALLQIDHENKKMMLDYQIKEQELALKKEEFNLKKATEVGKAILTNKEMNLQANLKNKQINKNTEKTDANITTGRVKGF